MKTFDKISQKATRTTTPKKDKGWLMPLKGAARTKVAKFFRLQYLANRIKGVIESFETAAKAELFKIWATYYVENKIKPPVSKVAFEKQEVDMEATFSVAFSASLNSVAKYDDIVAAGKTPQQYLINKIEESGLPHEKAVKFVQNEVTFTDEIDLTMSLNAMLNSPKDSPEYTFGQKLLALVKTIPTTECKAGLQTTQNINIKDGMLDRLLDYCDNVDEITALLDATKQQRKILKPTCGKNLNQEEEIVAMQATVQEFITG